MATYPKSVEERKDLDSRLGIKSSLRGIPSVIALGYVLYRAIDKDARIIYSEQDGIKITLRSNLEKNISDYYGVTSDELNKNPLLTAQLEAIQVGFSLMFKLGVVKFVDYPNADTKERTGRQRYRKEILFSTNMSILDLYISSWDEAIQKEELCRWLKNEPSRSEFSLGLKRLLTIFSEDTLFKIRTEDEQDIIFQQEGIYSKLLNGESVIGKDKFEDVGPFRVFKSVLREDLHPYLKLETNELLLKDELSLHNYTPLVQTSLSLCPKGIWVVCDKENDVDDKILSSCSRQTIFFGTPGSGKSHKVKVCTEGKRVHRITFHPDSDYASFVGCYKPTMVQQRRQVLTEDELKQKLQEYLEDGASYPVHRFSAAYPEIEKVQSLIRKEWLTSLGKTDSMDIEIIKGVACAKEIQRFVNPSEISYSFTPQVFTEAYIDAWENREEGVYLVIEEINRGNCAQIFGDLFQLLDRNSEGYSDYCIMADRDLRDYLVRELGNDHEGIKEGKLCLPPNLYILATMNTSDQSLFPMDSAFKRRWDWVYVPVDYSESIPSGRFVITLGEKKYLWVEFLKIANEHIRKATDSEDKQMGNFFIKANVSETEFKNKVMFYLWNEVCRDEYGTPNNFFRSKVNDEEIEFSFNDLYQTDGLEKLQGFMTYLGVTIQSATGHINQTAEEPTEA